MFYTKEELTTLPRKELQKLCKQFSIKANKKVRYKYKNRLCQKLFLFKQAINFFLVCSFVCFSSPLLFFQIQNCELVDDLVSYFAELQKEERVSKELYNPLYPEDAPFEIPCAFLNRSGCIINKLHLKDQPFCIWCGMMSVYQSFFIHAFYLCVQYICT